MKHSVKITALLIALFLFIQGCEQDDVTAIKRGSVSLSFTDQAVPSGRTQSTTPAAVFITIRDNENNSVVNKKLDLVSFGSSLVTESVDLFVGAYQITSFIILDSDDNALYATPVEGSEKAPLVQNPLPIDFQVKENENVLIRPEVLSVSNDDTPSAFGYVQFSFDVVTRETIPVGVKVELKIGQHAYLDVNTQVKVTGYNQNNEAVWSQNYDYNGPYSNMLQVRKGFYRYAIEVSHFGIVSRQIVNGNNLFENSKGPVPVTYVLVGETQAKKLKSQYNYAGVSQDALNPSSRTDYEYSSSGSLSKMTVTSYNPITKTYSPERYFEFDYFDGKVSEITGYNMDGTAYVKTTYSYGNDGRVSSIREVNQSTAITNLAIFTYNDSQRSVKVSYMFSNGSAFEYQFNNTGQNITSARLTRSASTCSEGTYTYDKGINPLSHLGYVDILLTNYGINNRISESVNYIACSFPSLIPGEYDVEVDAQGYATKSTTHYTNSTYITEKRFEYH